MKKYETPELHVDEFVPDTMIASSGGGAYKNGNPDNNQNCWACNLVAGAPAMSGPSGQNPNNLCLYTPNDGALYQDWCK